MIPECKAISLCRLNKFTDEPSLLINKKTAGLEENIESCTTTKTTPGVYSQHIFKLHQILKLFCITTKAYLKNCPTDPFIRTAHSPKNCKVTSEIVLAIQIMTASTVMISMCFAILQQQIVIS